ncbi:D-xylose ABC transporter ATP-binding protein [candidate division KSB3 bacterium]|uniref:D-xylose ABC transporter ATP-binding protein n=1 Tax=candidate division KSB3 bacterium TaxID=2044937 RepID=A0A2G6KBE8_9BACT|nr:MAG: D-xylose ABC transporter ATP-binding protein [candidate division KSB3 bacterium]
MRGITKEFPGVKALDNVQLTLRKGECHALLGENGAGKSTLMKILSGVYSLDQGEIRLRGQNVVFTNTDESQRAGIGFVHQELNLIPQLSVAENIFLGREPLSTKLMEFIDRKKLVEDTQEVLSRIHMDFDPTKPVCDFSIAHQQMIELAKAISFDADIVILDEPTSSLTDTEVKELFQMIRSLKAKDVSVVYISHRMEEIKEICDRLTVFRDGQFVGTGLVKNHSIDDIINMMVGRDLTEQYPPRENHIGEEMLKAENITREGVLDDVSISVRKGEILGLAGLVGAGRTELARCIFGADPKQSGRIYVDGQEVKIGDPNDAINAGICLIPEDRKNQGLVLDFSVENNILLPLAARLSRWGMIDASGIESISEEQCESLQIKTPSIKQQTKLLSGGNQQKVVLAKWLSAQSRILIFDEPTRGIDVGAKFEIYKLMNDLVEKGNAIIMISSELPEILGMSDRIAVMCNGKITGELSQEDATQEKIMTFATGQA